MGETVNRWYAIEESGKWQSIIEITFNPNPSSRQTMKNQYIDRNHKYEVDVAIKNTWIQVESVPT